MRSLIDSWKYLIKNIWFVLPFAVLPAVFLALSFDYTEINAFLTGFFTGDPRMDFLPFFRMLSLVRIDSILGGVYSLLAFASIVLCTALMLAFVEKHLRIGKRTLSGIYASFLNSLFPSFVVTLVISLLYELWALLFSAMLLLVSTIPVTALVYVLIVIVFVLFTAALLYVASAVFLWLPCRQATGFGFYDSFLYSYRLMIGMRKEFIQSGLVLLFLTICAIGGSALLPEYAFCILTVLVVALLYLQFCIRMELDYFRLDKLDREDLLHSYKEY